MPSTAEKSDGLSEFVTFFSGGAKFQHRYRKGARNSQMGALYTRAPCAPRRSRGDEPAWIGHSDL